MLKIKLIPTKKVMVILIICGFFFFMAIKTVQVKDIKADARLILKLKGSHQAELRLDVDGQSIKKRIFPENGFQPVDFKLPKKDITKIKLFLGNKPGSVSIKQVTLKTLLKSYRWAGESIPKLFNYQYNIRKTGVEKGVYVIETHGDMPFLGMVHTMTEIINKVMARKSELYLLVLILTGFLFFILFYFSLENLKIFARSWKTHQRVAGFLLLIFFPLLNSSLKIVKPIEIQERRARYKKPAFRMDALHDYLIQYQNYYNDHFVLRNSFIRLTNLVSYRLFNYSSVPMVLAGKEGWLFMSREIPQRDEVDYFRSVKPFSQEELQQWCQVLNQRHQWLLSMGIHYLLVIVPNKSTIYPDFMPDYIRQVRLRSRLDQLLEYVSFHSRVKILDIRDALTQAKERYPVFYKTDSHWNDYGAYIGYTEIMGALAGIKADEQAIPLEQFDLFSENRVGGDLAGALSLQKREIREDILKMVPRVPFRARTVHRENLSRYVTKSISVCETGGYPTALMVHDSFIHELRPFLAQHFSRMVFIWDWGLNIYPEIIRQEKPWIVIEEMAERYLLDKILSNPQEVADFNAIPRVD
jgi:hypothetical protein